MFVFLSLLAKLDKADRAFCFTSGMAALAAVTHLVSNGSYSFAYFVSYIFRFCFVSTQLDENEFGIISSLYSFLGLLGNIEIFVVVSCANSRGTKKCAGEEIVAGDDLYGGTDRLLSQVTPKYGVVVKSVLFLLLFISSKTSLPILITK